MTYVKGHTLSLKELIALPGGDVFQAGYGNLRRASEVTRSNAETIMDDSGTCKYVMSDEEFNALPFLVSTVSLSPGSYWLYLYEPDGSYADSFVYRVKAYSNEALVCDGVEKAGFRAVPM